MLENEQFSEYENIQKGIGNPEYNEKIFESEEMSDETSLDESVKNAFWEEFEHENVRETAVNQRKSIFNRMAQFTDNLMTKDVENSQDVISSIQNFIKAGQSPLEKYYDELK